MANPDGGPSRPYKFDEDAPADRSLPSDRPPEFAALHDAYRDAHAAERRAGMH